MIPQMQICGRTLRTIGAFAAVCLVAQLAVMDAAAAQGDELPEAPAEYERYALENNRALHAHYQRWQASLHEADAAAASWPQPSLDYTYKSDAMWADEPSPRHMATLAQQIPWPGVLDKSAEPARWKAEVHRHRFEEEVLGIVFEVREALIDIARLEAIADLVDEQREVYREVAGIIEEIMAVGNADYGDFLRVQLAEEKLADRLDTLESKRQQAVADLRQALDMGPNVELTFDFEDEGHDPLEVPEESPAMAVLVKHVQAHPHLQTAHAEAQRARARGDYARARRLPWPTVRLGVENMPSMRREEADRMTALVAGVSVPLPIFGGQYAEEERRFIGESEAVYEDHFAMHRDMTSQVEASHERVDEQLERLERYEDNLLPLAAEASEEILSQIEVGEEEVTDFLLSFREELDLEIGIVEARATLATERARLEQLTGGRFSAYPDRTTPTVAVDEFKEGEE